MIPINSLSKKELTWMAVNRCLRHRVSYLGHYNCYIKEKGKSERIGFFDIETFTFGFKADLGVMLSYCIKDSDSKHIYEAVITKEDIDKGGNEDKRVVEQCIKDLGRFDKIITYYGSRFDIPFLRTRAFSCKIKFPNYGAIVHKDLYFLVRSKFKLSNNKLETACRVILNKSRKTRFNHRYWRGGVRGDKKSLEYILKHNRYDVLDLEKLYYRIIGFARKSDTSI